MKEKSKLGKKKMFTDHDMTKEEKNVQRAIRESCGGKKEKKKR